MGAETCVEFVQAQHVWGEWSEPYPVAQLESWWQERHCQCGNRDFRPIATPKNLTQETQ